MCTAGYDTTERKRGARAFFAALYVKGRGGHLARRVVEVWGAALFAVLLLVALVLILLVVAFVLIVALVLIAVVLVVLVVLTVIVLHEMTSFRPIVYRRILDNSAGKYAFAIKMKKAVDKHF